jgi:fatty-acyl-CoA synthase
LIYYPDQKILYRDQREFTYRQFGQRVAQLAHALDGLGVQAGDTVAVMDWDSHRYLECYFAVPMIGAILHTGDIGYIDEEGYLRITDRLKDVIKTGGEWISSLELEDIISRHPGVSEVAVIGVKDRKWGERPMAMVVPKQAAARPLTEDDIRGAIQPGIDQGTLPKYAMPEKVLLVDQIAKTSVGKINKKQMRQDFD